MKISDLDQPRIGDIVEFETDPETVVEGLIVGETADGYIYEFSESGYTELDEACTYGKYYCSTDKKYKCRQGPKQGRDVAESNDFTDARMNAIKAGKTEFTVNGKTYKVTGDTTDELEAGVKEEKQRLDPKCWDGYKKQGTKMKGGVRVNNCVPESAGYIAKNSAEAKDPRFSASMTVDVGTGTMRKQLDAFFPTEAPQDGQEQIREAEYHGREVPLGRPMRGDVKKFKVYVRNKKGKVVKVNFGDPNMRIKKSNPARRRSFRARHNCKTPGPRDKARYWSCRKW